MAEKKQTKEAPETKEKWSKKIDIRLSLLELVCIIGNLELALRHPENIRHSSELTKQLGQFLSDIVIKEGLNIPQDIRILWNETFGR